MGNVVKDIRSLMADRGVVDVVFHPHTGYGAAHALAQFGLENGLRFFGEDIAPSLGWNRY